VTALRIVVLGYLVRGPLGGLAWHHLQYVLGLARLGHDVHFLEDSDDYPSCYDPRRDVVDADPSYGLRFAAHAFDTLGMPDRWAYYDAHTSRWLGPAASRAPDLCARAELLLNVSGVNPLRPWLAKVRHRVFIDTDPAFTQIRHLIDPAAHALALAHTAFFTFAENIADSTVPDDGFPWQPTRQPIVLDAWPVTPGPPDARFATVMQWDSYQARDYAGRRYGMKSDSFAPYIDLPTRAGPRFELALGSPTAPRESLEAKGWLLRDPRPPTRDPWEYQRYIRESKGEWGVAKHGYVVTNSGWFSERSAAWLASGRPVITQDTGFSRWLPTGAGLLPFTTVEEALAAIEELDRHYEHHCHAARQLAATHFDSDKVLADLLARTGV
jgi:hypothetical protein